MLRGLRAVAKHGYAMARRLTGTTRLTREQWALLALMRADNALAAPQYRPGPGRGWQKLVTEFEDRFHLEGIGAVETQLYNARFSSFAPEGPAYYQFATFQLYQMLRQHDRWGAFERLKATQRAGVTGGRHVVVYDCAALTWDVLISLQSLFAIAEYAPQVFVGPVALLDLGGGWGRLGNVLLRINPSAVYIDADLPETLLIAESYLPSTLPGIDVYRYAFHRKSREICRAALLKQPGVHFIGSHMLPMLEDRAIDLFVSIASFQEMTNEQVDAYFEVIDRVTSGHLYVQQLALSNPSCGFSVNGEDYYPFRPNWSRCFVRPCPHIPNYFEAMFSTRALNPDGSV